MPCDLTILMEDQFLAPVCRRLEKPNDSVYGESSGRSLDVGPVAVVHAWQPSKPRAVIIRHANE